MQLTITTIISIILLIAVIYYKMVNEILSSQLKIYKKENEEQKLRCINYSAINSNLRGELQTEKRSLLYSKNEKENLLKQIAILTILKDQYKNYFFELLNRKMPEKKKTSKGE